MYFDDGWGGKKRSDTPQQAFHHCFNPLSLSLSLSPYSSPLYIYVGFYDGPRWRSVAHAKAGWCRGKTLTLSFFDIYGALKMYLGIMEAQHRHTHTHNNKTTQTMWAAPIFNWGKRNASREMGKARNEKCTTAVRSAVRRRANTLKKLQNI